jgi:hypothetical protein
VRRFTYKETRTLRNEKSKKRERVAHNLRTEWEDLHIPLAAIRAYEPLGYTTSSRHRIGKAPQTEGDPAHQPKPRPLGYRLLAPALGTHWCTAATAPTSEPASKMKQDLGDTVFNQMIDEMNERNCSTAPARKPARDADLTQLQRQGVWTTHDPLVGPNEETLRRLITIDTNSTNPDVDITPPGKYALQTGLRWPTPGSMGSDAPRLHGHAAHESTVYTYSPNGSLIACLTAPRMHALYVHHCGTDC